MSKGTVVYAGAFELPDKNAAAHRVYNNAKILKSIGYNVVFLDVDRSGQLNEENCGLQKKEDQYFEVWSKKFPMSRLEGRKYLISIKNIKKIIKKHEDTKIIICYNYHAIALWRILNYAKKNNIKVIADCTEWYEDRSFSTELRMRYLHKKVDGIICISNYLENYYSDYVKTVVLPPLIDKNDEKWISDVVNIKTDEKVVNLVYSGSPGKHKDKLNLIIGAISELEDSVLVRFKIIGITEEEYLQYYPEQNQIIKELEGVLKFYGQVSHEESILYVKEADFQIFIRENKRVNNAGFPTKFVESMSCGTPVITTKTSDLEKYIENGKNGFLIQGYGVDDITNTLKKVIKLDRSVIISMKQNCKEINHFHFLNFKKQVEEFINKIV